MRINSCFQILVTSPHGRDASSHKIWCRYLYPIWSYWHFSRNSKWRPPPSWICWGAMGPPTKAHSWCVPSQSSCKKFRHDRLNSFKVIRIWIFCRSDFARLPPPKKISFLVVWPSKLRCISFRPQTALTCAEGRVLRLEPLLVQIWRTGLAKKTKKTKKTVANWPYYAIHSNNNNNNNNISIPP